MARITITLTEGAKKALIEYAQKEIRDPRAQGAIIIVNKLRQLGYLSNNLDISSIEEGEGIGEDINEIQEEEK